MAVRAGRDAAANIEADAAGEFSASFQAVEDLLPQVALGRMREYIESEFAVAGAADGCGELRFVSGEDADAFASAGNRDVPLLGVCCGAGGGVGKDDVLDGLALRTIGRDGVASRELPELGRNDSSVFERDCSIFVCSYGIYKIPAFHF